MLQESLTQRKFSSLSLDKKSTEKELDKKSEETRNFVGEAVRGRELVTVFGPTLVVDSFLACLSGLLQITSYRVSVREGAYRELTDCAVDKASVEKKVDFKGR